MGNNIGNIIKNRRLELNITLDEVGKAVGVSKSTVQRWESGQITNMRRDRIDALSKILGYVGGPLNEYKKSQARHERLKRGGYTYEHYSGFRAGAAPFRHS